MSQCDTRKNKESPEAVPAGALLDAAEEMKAEARVNPGQPIHRTLSGGLRLTLACRPDGSWQLIVWRLLLRPSRREVNVCLQAFQAPKAGRETKRLTLDHRLGFSCTWREVASSTPAEDSVTQCVTSKLSQWVTIRFDPETLGELRSIARQKGIGPTSLIRLWVMERLRADAR